MILVKNFNLVFLITIVVITNLIDGAQFNKTPENQDTLDTNNNKINDLKESSSKVAINGKENIVIFKNDQDTGQQNNENESLLDEMTDLTQLSDEQRQELLKKNSEENLVNNSTELDEMDKNDKELDLKFDHLNNNRDNNIEAKIEEMKYQKEDHRRIKDDIPETVEVISSTQRIKLDHLNNQQEKPVMHTSYTQNKPEDKKIDDQESEAVVNNVSEMVKDQLNEPLKEEPKESVEEPKESVEEPKESAEEPKESVEEPKESEEEPKESVEEPKESVEEPKELEVLERVAEQPEETKIAHVNNHNDFEIDSQKDNIPNLEVDKNMLNDSLQLFSNSDLSSQNQSEESMSDGNSIQTHNEQVDQSRFSSEGPNLNNDVIQDKKNNDLVYEDTTQSSLSDFNDDQLTINPPEAATINLNDETPQSYENNDAINQLNDQDNSLNNNPGRRNYLADKLRKHSKLSVDSKDSNELNESIDDSNKIDFGSDHTLKEETIRSKTLLESDAQKERANDVDLNNSNQISSHNEISDKSEEKYEVLTNSFVNETVYPTKFCAEIQPIKKFFNDQIGALYIPIIGLLSEEMQIILMSETKYGGLNTISCVTIVSIFTFITFLWYLIIRHSENQKLFKKQTQHEQFLIIENNLKKSVFEKQTFELELNELEEQLNECQLKLIEKDEKIKHLNEINLSNANNVQSGVKDLEKSRVNEMKLHKELTAAKLELASFKERFEMQQNEYQIKRIEFEQENIQKVETLSEELFKKEISVREGSNMINELKSQLESLIENENKSNEIIMQHEKTIEMLQNSLLRENSKKSANNLKTQDEESIVVVSNADTENETAETLDGVMRIAELQMEMKKLEDALENSKKAIDDKSFECDKLVEKLNEKSSLIEQLEQRLKNLEKAIKEQEMQNSLLNELREKDTKQHIKALTDLDLQLKKKSSDADKVSHFLEQLRIKQERIQELESQFARIERQANQERQTFDRQTHETWLNARKIEKELKESKLECSSLKEKLAELEIMNKSLSEHKMTSQFTQNSSKNMFISPLHQQYQLQQNSNSSLLSNSENSKKSAESQSPSANKDVSELSNQIADAANSLDSNSLVNEPINKPIIHNQGSTEQLQVDTDHRPSSRSSNSSGIQLPHMPMGMHPQFSHNPYIRPPIPGGFRYPYPNPQMAAYYQQQQQNSEGGNSENRNPIIPPYPSYQSPAMMYRMQSMMAQQQYLQQQMTMNQSQVMSKSNVSSQQPSPNDVNQSYTGNSINNNSSLHGLNSAFPKSSTANDTSVNSINFNDSSFIKENQLNTDMNMSVSSQNIQNSTVNDESIGNFNV